MKSPPPPFVTLCGRVFRDTDRSYFPNADWQGHTLYFCTQVCLEAFLADPEAFYRSHRNSEKKKGPVTKDERHLSK